ncbi:MAG: alpha/beta hydrolase, partial [Clostridia bacterium]|nr:alpha/beta hydrolase [Clostridia bacterium]
FSKFVARTFILFGQSKKRIFISKPEQIPDYCKDPSAYGVLSRRQQQDLLKFSDENYMTNGPSYRWMLESLLVTKKILARGKPEGITIPVLLCQAQNDMLVINSAQDSFVARVPNATKYEASGSQHEIYNETDEISIPYFDTILDYLTNT